MTAGRRLWQDWNKIAMKALILLLTAFLCSQILMFADGSPHRIRRRLVPRHMTQKEIRGPTYHIHHSSFNHEESIKENSILHSRDFLSPQRKRIISKYIKRFDKLQVKHMREKAASKKWGFW